MRRYLLGAVALLALGACGPTPAERAAAEQAERAAAVATESQKLNAYLDAEYEEELAMSPEELTSQGRREGYDRLDDRSEEGLKRRLDWRRESVAGMKSDFSYDLLDEEARTSYDMWALELDREERADAFRRQRYLFARGGGHTSIPNFLINFHRVETRPDMDAYIARVRLIDDALDQLLERAKAAAADGVRQPRFAYDQALGEVKRLMSGAPFSAGADSALFADGKTKIEGLLKAGLLSKEEAEALTRDLTSAMKDEMKPAYDRVSAWLAADRANTSPDAKGVDSLPNGAAYYDAMLKQMTTTDMTADEIHELGLQEVARIRKEMEAIKNAVGFKGDLEEFFTFMRTDRRFYFPNTDEGREEYLALARTYLDGMNKKLPEYFGILPKAPLEVRRVEAFREEPGGAQHYFAGAPDGSRPGVFYAHLSDMNAMSIYQLESIAFHEGNPGHHMQISIAQEREGLPKFRTQYGYTAYSEGWGLYSEALAKEMGFYTDPYSDFGRLGGEIWRACRLVLDTGIHSKGWSEEQAVEYFMKNSPVPEGAVRSEVRRYISTPGQATAYKIGMIRIQQLRDQAKSALGDAFDYRAFHDVVLGGGSLPLPVLTARIERWIESRKAATP